LAKKKERIQQAEKRKHEEEEEAERKRVRQAEEKRKRQEREEAEKWVEEQEKKNRRIRELHRLEEERKAEERARVTTMQPTQRMMEEQKKVTQDKKKTKLARRQGELMRKEKQSSPEVSEEANGKEAKKRKRASQQGGSTRNEKGLPKCELRVSRAKFEKCVIVEGPPNKKRRVEAEEPPTSLVLQDNSTDMYLDADNNDIGPIDEHTIQGARQQTFYSLPRARDNRLADAKLAIADRDQDILYWTQQRARRKQEMREQRRKRVVQAAEEYQTRGRGIRAIGKVEEEKRKWEKTAELEEERLQFKVRELKEKAKEAAVAVRLHRQHMEATREDFEQKLATERAAARRDMQDMRKRHQTDVECCIQ
jgi:hypothetical protein